MNDFVKSVGTRIRYLRKQKKLSQEELAYKADINRSYLGELERGEKVPRIDILYKISSALDITLEDFFKYVQPSIDKNDDKYLSFLIDRINTLSPSQRKLLLEFIDLLIKWN